MFTCEFKRWFYRQTGTRRVWNANSPRHRPRARARAGRPQEGLQGGPGYSFSTSPYVFAPKQEDSVSIWVKQQQFLKIKAHVNHVQDVLSLQLEVLELKVFSQNRTSKKRQNRTFKKLSQTSFFGRLRQKIFFTAFTALFLHAPPAPRRRELLIDSFCGS